MRQFYREHCGRELNALLTKLIEPMFSIIGALMPSGASRSFFSNIFNHLFTDNKIYKI